MSNIEALAIVSSGGIGCEYELFLEAQNQLLKEVKEKEEQQKKLEKLEKAIKILRGKCKIEIYNRFATEQEMNLMLEVIYEKNNK